jgi:hypothetical protein
VADGAASSRGFPLFRMSKEAADDAAQVAQVAPDQLFHQVGFRAIDSAADIEIDGGVTG